MKKNPIPTPKKKLSTLHDKDLDEDFDSFMARDDSDSEGEIVKKKPITKSAPATLVRNLVAEDPVSATPDVKLMKTISKDETKTIVNTTHANSAPTTTAKIITLAAPSPASPTASPSQSLNSLKQLPIKIQDSPQTIALLDRLRQDLEAEKEVTSKLKSDAYDLSRKLDSEKRGYENLLAELDLVRKEIAMKRKTQEEYVSKTRNLEEELGNLRKENAEIKKKLAEYQQK
jgi:hypothetical protein